MRVTAVALLLTVLAAPTGPGATAQDRPGRLFSPGDLGLLEGPDRDDWQQPDRVMDLLGIGEAAHVADLGAGGGWFTVRLAHRVGPNGVVYAVDIQPEMIDTIRRRVEREGLRNVRLVLGTPTNPTLPGGLHAVLMVDTFPQLSDPVALMKNVHAALAPNGRFGIVDFTKAGAGGPGPDISERADPDVVIRAAEAAGFRLRSHETFLRYQYVLVFVK